MRIYQYYLHCILLFLVHHTNARRYPNGLSFFGHDLSLKQRLLNISIISNLNHGMKRKLLNENQNVTDIQYPVSLNISPSVLSTPNGFETISIEWSGATMATYTDWIGIYSPPNASDIDYLDFFDTYGAMNGVHQYRIWNMRNDYEVRYFSTDWYTNYELLGVSNIASVSYNQPLQGHLSLTKRSPNEMQIRWVSSFISNAMVQIGVISQQYNVSYRATYSTYNTSSMCGSSASIISSKQFRDPGYIYTVIMSRLKSNTQYFYRFGNEEYWSDEQSFITSSQYGTSKPFGFIMYGDQGTTQDSFKHIKAVKNEIENDVAMMKLVLHIGDLSYAWGNAYNWDKWGNMISQVAMTVPYMISIGNHEYDHYSPPNDAPYDVSGVAGDGYHPEWGNFHDDSNGECGAPSYYRFDADICDNGNSIFWYSFNYESVHFIMLSSEHNYSQNTDGYNFLVNDLSGINHTITPWIIVNIHRPLYQSEIYVDDNIVDDHLLQLLEAIFYEYKVDLVLAGHFHSYERTCAVYNYSCIGRENGGIVHLTMGAAGWELDNANYTPNHYILFRNEIDFGYGKFLLNETHLTAQYITIDDKAIIDQVVLKKKNKNEHELVAHATTTQITQTTAEAETVSETETKAVSETETETETGLMECVPSSVCLCILPDAVCCNGNDYASQCDADCECVGKCRKGKCVSMFKQLVIGGCLVLFLCGVLFCYRWFNQWRNAQQIRYQLAVDDDDFNYINDDDMDEDYIDNDDADIQMNQESQTKTNILNEPINIDS